jgi:hypothetical protein
MDVAKSYRRVGFGRADAVCRFAGDGGEGEVVEIKSRNCHLQFFLQTLIADKVQFGVANYHWRRSDHSTVINDLFQTYQVEGITMPYTFEDYYRDFTRRHLDWLTAEERLKGLPVEERLKGLPVEERLKGLPVEERLKGLSAKEIEAYLKKLSKKRRKRK